MLWLFAWFFHVCPPLNLLFLLKFQNKTTTFVFHSHFEIKSSFLTKHPNLKPYIHKKLGKEGKPPYKNETTIFSYMKKIQIFKNVHHRHHNMSFKKTIFMYVIANIKTIERIVCMCV
jgi:hypothetical protein